jgi:hypothetical protein
MERKNTALILEGDEPIFFDNEDKMLAHIMDTQEHNDPESRSVPGCYLYAITQDSTAGLLYRDRDWLEEQFNELNGHAGQACNEEYEARYGE